MSFAVNVMIASFCVHVPGGIEYFGSGIENRESRFGGSALAKETKTKPVIKMTPRLGVLMNLFGVIKKLGVVFKHGNPAFLANFADKYLFYYKMISPHRPLLVTTSNKNT